MILEALVAQIEQRFLHEKRARVCLWFDERGEFARVISGLEAHLGAKKTAPFVLLGYDGGRRRGQIWLKHQLHQRLEATPFEERAALRFLIYLPLAEERLDPSSRSDETRLDLLEEFRAIGVFFRIGGKRPTLFSFLKQAGVALPDHALDQRRLYEGGRDSLLAKYTAKFIDRPPVFWQTTLTPDVAQSRLIGDVDQTIFEIAADPDASWKALREKGLDHELVAMVQERYGFDVSDRAPADWLQDFVTTVALTETFLEYHEPADFPLLSRLPPLPLRAHHVALLHRWLRDAEFRPTWDRWIATAEESVDLTAWAQERAGCSVAFPHLVWLRWRRSWDEFEIAAKKESSTEAFFTTNRDVLAEQAEFLKATSTELGNWQVLRDLDGLVAACNSARAEIAKEPSTKQLVSIYVDNAAGIESAHLRLRYAAEEAGLHAVARVADRSYAAYTNALNEMIFQRVAKAGTLDVLALPGVTKHLEHALWKAHGRRAVIIVDALRYDCAVAIGEALRTQTVTVKPMLAMLPTITSVGMTALLPLQGASVSLDIKNNSLHPKVNGKDLGVRENRLGYLTAFGADCRDIAVVEAEAEATGLGDLLVVFGHEEVDHIGHGQAETLIRHIHLEVVRLARLVKKLHRWGFADVHIVTDHGFVLLDESKLPSEVHCDKAWCHVLKERFALVPASADLPLVKLPFAWDAQIHVAVPPGLAFFKTEKSFSHGGAAIQELVIPHLVSRSHTAQTKRIGVEVVLPAFELQRPLVKVTLRAISAVTKQAAQQLLFAETGRVLTLEVLRTNAEGAKTTVLAGKAKEVRLDPKDEQTVTLFFNSSAMFQTGELLHLDIRDVETMEQFPPGGIKLTVGRDM